MSDPLTSAPVTPAPEPVPAPVPPPVDPPARGDRPGGVNPVAVLAAVAAFACPPVGIWLGKVARRQVDRTGQPGAGLATIGVVAGTINSVLIAAAGLFLAALYGAAFYALGGSSASDWTGPGVEATTGPPPTVEQTMIWDAEEMTRLQWQYRDEHPGTLGQAVTAPTGTTMIGDEPFQAHAENRVRVVLADPAETIPDGGFCVVVTNPDVPKPLLFDSAIIQGGSFLDEAMAGVPAAACADLPEAARP